MRGLRNAFFTGLLLSMPLAITIYVVRLLVDLASKPLRNHVMELVRHLASKTDANMQVQDNFWVEQFVVLLSALLVVAAITIIGWFSRYFLGRLLINSLETIIERVPMIKSVYASIKQIVSTFGSKNKANFKQVVLVQFPHAEAWTLAFVTNRDSSELSTVLGYPVAHVFVPTTPNPTGGYFLVVRESAIKPLQMSVAEGMRLIVSGGAVLPEAPAVNGQPCIESQK